MSENPHSVSRHWHRQRSAGTVRQMAQAAYEKLDGDVENRDFYRAKIKTAEFYFERILPRTKSLAVTMMASPKTLMQLKEELL